MSDFRIVDRIKSSEVAEDSSVGSLIKRNNISIGMDNNLRKAVELMAQQNVDILPVISGQNTVVGVLSYKDVISSYKYGMEEHEKKNPSISLKRNSLKILIRGQKLITGGKRKLRDKN